ncbi:MAG: YceD family protein [Candidatus Limnocylindria bacterium]
MIVFNVAGMLQEAPGSTREVALRDRYLAVGADVELAGPVDGRIRLQRTNRGILLRGSMDAPVRRTCSRCLEPFVETVHLQLAEEFLPTVDPLRGVPLAAPAADEEALTIDAQHQIDLTPVLHDELALSEPMHPLCRPDCPGLCPGCGRHMDVGSCDCSFDEPDPRLAALARLLEGTHD